MDYGLTQDVFADISGSAYLFRSGALSNVDSAISASIPQIIAVTCSANTNNILTRFPFRSSDITAGPYYVNATSDAGATAGTAGYFYPLYINESSASGASDGSGAHEHTFAEIPGTIFYMPSNHMGHAGDFAAASTSGNNYYGGAGVASGASISFNEGIKEVYVTYPGKYSVYTAYGLDGFEEPRYGGVAFWGSEQALNYDSNVVWSGGNLGIFQTNPQHAIDVG